VAQALVSFKNAPGDSIMKLEMGQKEEIKRKVYKQISDLSNQSVLRKY
jgi:hypothetical protein